MAAPNIVNVATITGKTAVLVASASATAIVTNSAASGKVLKINSLYCANVDTSATYSVTIDLYRSTTAYRIGNSIAIPIYATVDILRRPIYLEEGDSLRITGSSANKIEAICSYEDIS
jgi:hypothetical protein